MTEWSSTSLVEGASLAVKASLLVPFRKNCAGRSKVIVSAAAIGLTTISRSPPV